MPSILTARWVLPITSPMINFGAIAIESERLVAIGSLPDVCSSFPEAPVNDLGEAVILPGFINIHTHLELTAFRGRLEGPHFQNWIAQLVRLKSERLTKDDLLASARLGCVETIKAGITTLADTSDADAPLPALIESGQRGVVFQECFGPKSEQAENSLDELMAKIEAHTEALARAGREAQSRLSLGISPHAPYSVSARLYQLAARFALDRKLDIAIHTAESADETKLMRDGSGAFGDSLRRREIDFSSAGSSTIRHFDRLGVLETAPLLIHCVTLDEEDLRLLAEHEARVAHCPKSNAKFGHGLAPLIELQKDGVRLGLGTDSVASNNSSDLIEEARFCSLLHRAAKKNATLCTAEEMLRLMTIEGARALKMEMEIGSLEVGKQADLIAIDLRNAENTPHYDPTTAIIFSCSARDVVLTMVAGRVLYKDHHVLSLDEQEVMRRIHTVSNKLAENG
ncbi:MAG: amidohydrolase family protein [Acidobacteria bacterium]|nr:amidohydrolase family protein [Acidobacteriota bacterium]